MLIITITGFLHSEEIKRDTDLQVLLTSISRQPFGSQEENAKFSIGTKAYINIEIQGLKADKNDQVKVEADVKIPQLTYNKSFNFNSPRKNPLPLNFEVPITSNTNETCHVQIIIRDTVARTSTEFNTNFEIKEDDNVIDYFYTGNDKFSKNNFRGAIDDFTKAIEYNQDKVLSYNNRGAAKVQLKDYQGAIQDYTEAIKLNPSYTKGYVNRANTLYKMGDIKSAIKDYNKIAQLDPKFIPDPVKKYCDTGYNLSIKGELLKNTDYYKQAIQQYSKAIEIKPDYAFAYIQRAIIKKDLNNIQGAIKDLNEALKFNPNYLKAYYLLGTYKLKSGNRKGACDDWSKGYKLPATDTSFRMDKEQLGELIYNKCR